ncbi:MAG: GNAT family N-acetyltransferase [SAR324 cluster bacterium]|nr:GNAT family N-acetyltransferase [SAR324 cluster bacterium]
MKYDISAATLIDYPNIDRIQSNAFATPWSKELIRSAILNGKYDVRVMKVKHKPVAGFYIAHVTNGRSNLDNLAVDLHLRGMGMGRKLLEDWIERACLQKTATLSLQVNTKNKGAQRLYQCFAFKKVRLLSGYYPNGDDAYQMEMPIKQQQVTAKARQA